MSIKIHTPTAKLEMKYDRDRYINATHYLLMAHELSRFSFALALRVSYLINFPLSLSVPTWYVGVCVFKVPKTNINCFMAYIHLIFSRFHNDNGAFLSGFIHLHIKVLESFDFNFDEMKLGVKFFSNLQNQPVACAFR